MHRKSQVRLRQESPTSRGKDNPFAVCVPRPFWPSLLSGTAHIPRTASQDLYLSCPPSPVPASSL
ncbi:hypothetical protein Mapa_007037 [Marchantia paleacea]|nr:hypothetical protein Mapa_007037 [Marchantia paleacea]